LPGQNLHRVSTGLGLREHSEDGLSYVTSDSADRNGMASALADALTGDGNMLATTAVASGRMSLYESPLQVVVGMFRLAYWGAACRRF